MKFDQNGQTTAPAEKVETICRIDRWPDPEGPDIFAVATNRPQDVSIALAILCKTVISEASFFPEPVVTAARAMAATLDHALRTGSLS